MSSASDIPFQTALLCVTVVDDDFATGTGTGLETIGIGADDVLDIPVIVRIVVEVRTALDDDVLPIDVDDISRGEVVEDAAGIVVMACVVVIVKLDDASGVDG